MSGCRPWSWRPCSQRLTQRPRSVAVHREAALVNPAAPRWDSGAEARVTCVARRAARLEWASQVADRPVWASRVAARLEWVSEVKARLEWRPQVEGALIWDADVAARPEGAFEVAAHPGWGPETEDRAEIAPLGLKAFCEVWTPMETACSS